MTTYESRCHISASRNSRTQQLRNTLFIDGEPLWAKEEAFFGHGELRFNHVNGQWHGQAFNIKGDLILSAEKHELNAAYEDIVSQSTTLEFLTKHNFPWLVYDSWLKPDGTGF